MPQPVSDDFCAMALRAILSLMPPLTVSGLERRISKTHSKTFKGFRLKNLRTNMGWLRQIVHLRHNSPQLLIEIWLQMLAFAPEADQAFLKQYKKDDPILKVLSEEKREPGPGFSESLKNLETFTSTQAGLYVSELMLCLFDYEHGDSQAKLNNIVVIITSMLGRRGSTLPEHKRDASFDYFIELSNKFNQMGPIGLDETPLSLTLNTKAKAAAEQPQRRAEPASQPTRVGAPVFPTRAPKATASKASIASTPDVPATPTVVAPEVTPSEDTSEKSTALPPGPGSRTDVSRAVSASIKSWPQTSIEPQKTTPNATPTPTTTQTKALKGTPVEKAKAQSHTASATLSDSKPTAAELSDALTLQPVTRRWENARPAMTLRPAGMGERRYLGLMLQMATFFNFLIRAEEKGDRFAVVNDEEMRTLYPRYGAINVRSSSRTAIKSGFFVMDIAPQDLDDNYGGSSEHARRDDYQFMVSYDTLNREKRIYPASDLGLFLVVHPIDEPNFERIIPVVMPADLSASDMSSLVNSQVMLAWQGQYYGPVPLRESADGKLTVNFQSSSTGGLVSGFANPDGVNALLAFEGLFYSSSKNETRFINLEVVQTALLRPFTFDVMSDETLLKKVANLLPVDRQQQNTFYEAIEGQVAASDLFSKSPQVRTERYKRVSNLLIQAKEDKRFFDTLASIVTHAMKTLPFEKTDLFGQVVDRIVHEPHLVAQLEASREIAAKIDEERDKLLEAQEKRREVEHNLTQLEEDIRNNVEARHQKLLDDNERLAQSIAKKREAIATLDAIADLNEAHQRLETQLEEQRAQKAALEEEIHNLGTSLKDSVKKYRKYAFDGLIANQFLEAASEWNRGNEQEKLQTHAAQVMAIEPSTLAGEKLVRQLVQGVKAWRQYETNDILNLFIAVTQNFLTVLSGPPGSGKTSICSILAQVCGLNTVGDRLTPTAAWPNPEESNRFLPISVERGWTSKRDFIGYWNPLTKSFESADQRRYEAFRQLDAEARAGHQTLPYWMLLDEANLSPMEYYWADFMNICDARDANSVITLGDKMQYRVPDTLRFVATINNDHTTEPLSPRLLDRAMIITLPEVSWQGMGLENEVRHGEAGDPDWVVSWPALSEAFGPRTMTSGRREVEDILSAIYEQMAKGGFMLSVRVHKAVEHYVSAAAALMDKADYASSALVAIDYAVAQKVLPPISGSGEAFRHWLIALADLLDNFGLVKSKNEVRRIIEAGDARMNYYRFF